MIRHCFLCAVGMTAVIAAAQDLNTEITVSHEVVPEERLATPIRVAPAISLPKLDLGRLSMESSLLSSPITPFINTLEASKYGTKMPRSPWRGYASVSYGPIYTLGASAGYRMIDREDLTADAWLQFNGTKYSSRFPGLDDYRDKVSLHRNTALAGVRTCWNPKANGSLSASVVYSFSEYNFPILSLADYTYSRHDINANYADANVRWQDKVSKVDYSVSADYNLMAFSGSERSDNNRGKLTAGMLWHYSGNSAWGIDFSASFGHSSMVGNKGVVHILPYYRLTTNKVTMSVGVLSADIRIGNTPYSQRMAWTPDFNICWQPSRMFHLWGKVNGALDDNYRGNIYQMQPYTLPSFDAGYSRIYNGEGGVTLGPWKGASISVFGGYTVAYDWYIGAVKTGEMTAVDMQGAHFGAQFDYKYHNILAVNVRGEYAPNTPGEYSRGYAPWRDHARFNLYASVAVDPIEPLAIKLSYQLRTSRNKMLAQGCLDLHNINNLCASVAYAIDRRWTVALSGENLINRSWYLGPSIPCQGVVGQVNVAYKF